MQCNYIRKEDARGRFVPSSLNCIVLIPRLVCMHLQNASTIRIYEKEQRKKFYSGNRWSITKLPNFWSTVSNSTGKVNCAIVSKPDYYYCCTVCCLYKPAPAMMWKPNFKLISGKRIHCDIAFTHLYLKNSNNTQPIGNFITHALNTVLWVLSGWIINNKKIHFC